MTIDGVWEAYRKAYRDWSGQLINPRMIRKGTKLTWSGDQRLRAPEHVREEDVAAIVSAGAFTLQVREDEAVIQLMYEFDGYGRQLGRACLAYFALTGAEPGQATDRADASETTVEDVDPGGEALPSEESRRSDGGLGGEPLAEGGVAWLRIDYEDGERAGVLHHDCHMHVGGFPDGRLPLNCVPNPQQFIEWIFAFRYPEIYRRHRLDESHRYKREEDVRQISTPQFAVDLREVAICVPHLAFPKGAIPPDPA